MNKLVLVAFLAGCVSTGLPVQVGPDIYTLSVTKYGASGRGEAIESAKAHCKKVGGNFVLVDSESYPTRMGLDTVTDITYQCGPRN